MEFGQIHHIEYYVNDLVKSNIFWNWFMEVMKYKKVAEWDGGVSFEHFSGTYIVFVQVLDEHLKTHNTRQGNGLNHIAFMGGSVEQLNDIQIQLESKGIKILKRDNKYLCFEDSNNFAIEIYAT